MKLFKSFRQLPITLKYWLAIGTLSCAIPQVAAAATLDDVVQSINQFRLYVESVVNDTKTSILQKMYEPNPSMPATVVGNQAIEAAKTTLAEKTYGLALAQVKQSFTNKDTAQARALARIPASDTLFMTSNPSIYATQSKEAPNLVAGDANFDFDTFLGTTAYTPLREIQAKNFIQLATGAYQPISDLTIEGLNADQMNKLQNNAAYRAYQLAVRSYITSQSVGIDNLYHLLSERIIQPNLGKQAGLYNSKGQPINDASPLQVREYLATRRTGSPQWYEDMAKASPATVSRESLFVLAEMRQELFTLQQQNERLLAALLLMGAQLNSSGKSQIQNLQQATEKEVNRIKGVPEPESAVPGLPSMPTQ
jgi:phage terminase small subunit